VISFVAMNAHHFERPRMPEFVPVKSQAILKITTMAAVILATTASAFALEMVPDVPCCDLLETINAALRSSRPSSWSWALMPVALLPLPLLVWLGAGFIRDQERLGPSRSEIIALLASACFSTIVIFTDVFSSLSPWIDPDDVGELARVMSLSNGEYFPIQGDYIHMWRLYQGPIATMWFALFGVFFKNHLPFALAPLISVFMTQMTGAAFLRRTFGRNAAVIFILLVPFHMAFMMSSSSHVMFGLPLGIMMVWILADAGRRNTDRHIPLYLLCAGIAVQLYAVNIAWIFTLPIIVTAFRRPSVRIRRWIAGFLLFLLPQVFTLFMLVADLQAGKSISGNRLGGPPFALLIGSAVVALLSGIVLIGIRFILGRKSLGQRMAAKPAIMIPSIFILHWGVVAAAAAFDLIEGTSFTFALASAYLAGALLVDLHARRLLAAFEPIRSRFIPAVVALSAIGYLAAWCSHAEGFRPPLSEPFRTDTTIAPRLMNFLKDAGLDDRQAYRENAHHLHQVTISVPLYPMFFLPRADGTVDDEEPLEVVFLPRRDSGDPAGDPFPDDPHAQMFSHNGLDVLAYPSRLSYAGQVATTVNCYGIASDFRPPWPWQPRPLMGDKMTSARAMLGIPLSDANDPSRLGYGTAETGPDKPIPSRIRLKTPLKPGSRRVLAVLVSTECESYVTIDQNPAELLVTLDYPDFFEDGDGYRVDLYEIDENGGLITVKVQVEDCSLQMLDLLDPPMDWQSMMQVLLEHGFDVRAF